MSLFGEPRVRERAPEKIRAKRLKCTGVPLKRVRKERSGTEEVASKPAYTTERRLI